jgi:outer membrane protein assembly factor BamB
MNDPQPVTPIDGWPRRAWPALFILVAVAALMVVPSLVVPRTMVHFLGMFLAPLVGTVALIGWWLFASRGRVRWLVPALILVPAAAILATLHRGNPMMAAVYGLPLLLVVAVVWHVLTRGLGPEPRRIGLALAMLGVWGLIGMVRIEGADGDMVPTLRWRWQPTDEELFAAERASRTAAAAGPRLYVVEGKDWPGFRGPARDGRIGGVKIDADRPPELLWKHRIGPGWGSFAVVGKWPPSPADEMRLITQEQRGADEAVVCYAAATGAELWEHRLPARFEEAIGGPGPRATPTIHEARVYAQGATGKLVCLDVDTGKPHWTADLTVDVGGVIAPWGYAASPLVVGGLVVVYGGGPNGKGTAAYRADTGQLAWSAGKATHSYSSPHRATLGGVEQVLLASDHGIESFAPADGKLLWEHAWQAKGLNRVTQPTVLNDTDLLLGTGVGNDQGTRRLRVMKTTSGWDVRTVWGSKAIRPYFNDGVVHGGHVYGFDGTRFCCVDLETGRETWKEGTYGSGQVLLLADQGLLVVQAEKGGVALVEANPAEHVERAKFPALSGKTWNHPVVVPAVDATDPAPRPTVLLFVRNGQEAACYRFQLPGEK